jgi:hypothetical protein
MNDNQREELLKRWIKPSSDNEVEQQERAVRMVREAIEASDLAGTNLRIYAKGSYANNTNVRRDSDVDVGVDCHECMYFDSFPDVVPAVAKPAYQGPWNGLAWRTAVEKAMVAKFGSSTKTSGSTAIYIPPVEGSRPSIDVVPGYHFRKYRNASGTSWFDGSKVFKKGGGFIINWPQQQLENGRAKNDATNKRYKAFVRALKNAENQLVKNGTITPKPSFLMEVLVYNVTNGTMVGGTLSSDFRSTLIELWSGLGNQSIYKEWIEPSKRKYAFHDSQKWTVADAKAVVRGAWNLLEYA